MICKSGFDIGKAKVAEGTAKHQELLRKAEAKAEALPWNATSSWV